MEDPKTEKIDTPRIDETSNEADNEFYVDPVKEVKLLAKLDLAFTPIIMLVYLSCFLDRSNIGNVKVAGMLKDIHATDQQFSTAVSIFYATYVTFETPAAVLMKKLTPRVILAALCCVWSLTTIFTSFVQNIGGLYATRLILGACEAGLFPCLNLYLTMVYRREEQAKRVAYLFSCSALSGAFGGLLAYALLQMDGISGVAGWRWVYIIEGIFSILIAIAVWFGLPTDPTQAWFLNTEEREMMRCRNSQRRQYLGSEKFDWAEVRIALTDPKLYMSGLIQFMQDILLYGFSTFLPSILKAMKYDTLQSNYLTIPVYLWGAISFLCIAWISDRYQIRGPLVIFANVFGIIGYILLLTVKQNGVKYFATYLCAIAVYVGPGINRKSLLTWLNVNIAPHYRRATAIGFQQTMGNTAGIVAGQIYRTAPYKLGNSFSLGALCLSQVLIAGKVIYVRRQNKLKDEIGSGKREDTRKVSTGDRELDFKYHI
ncbi:putative transporter [Lachnellula hyalina]|uniref:Putative transporter n=1 Tax=Lachnellula hyalina TaxID=1316788 RepID=A0A8H8RC66_9HELO|nr:putative transporter [Lachnellula hyalina]TVY30666.1 putative transporter [Lachnellula hyalina]